MSASTERTLEVVAPSNLDGGYEFFVTTGINMSVKVRVPDGGVKKDERFEALVVSQNATSGAHNIPSGRWRDDLFQCCAFGCCHPMCCLSLWCTACALGQLLHRNKLDVLGGPTSNGQAPAMSAFKILFALSIVVIVGDAVIGAAFGDQSASISTDTTTEYDDEVKFGGGYLRVLLSFFCFLVTMRLRAYIRGKYAIKGSCCEDCCCSFWCTPCTVCHIARHTADFNAHPAACCSENGLNPGAPDVV